MTSLFKQTKTPRLEVVIQITEIAADREKVRTFEVHDVERNRGFRITLPAALAAGASEADVERAIGVAIERALQTPPEKLPGQVYPVDLTRDDLRAGAQVATS
ncbi:MAG: hypothetical protein AB7O37_19540 [Vicinamibacteria bacterium]